MRLENLIQGLSPTNRQYLKDSYLTKFTANVLQVGKEGKNKIYVVLGTTVFHPKSGGQPSDTGVLSGSKFKIKVAKVMGVQDVIVHWGTMEGDIGDIVFGQIDWEPRYLYMRRHTAGHLLDHCLAKVSEKPIETTDSWLGEECYVAYHGILPSEDTVLRAIEMENKLISHGGPVLIEEMDVKELKRRAPNAPNALRLPKLEKYRVATIQGCEPIPCGGTHLRDIGEIRSVTLDRIE
ncbi:alanyl-tRNA editing protein, partial [Candidatus Bathyarchaeota archaeon]|nr:alanyl-tRNA editing protein [Candidatus Bathyarchaeota archaeon]